VPDAVRSSTSVARWREFLKANRRSPDPPPTRLLCLDPGETVGWAFFHTGILENHGQVSLHAERLTPIVEVIRNTRPDIIVCEDYKVYAHKAAEHVGSKVPTIQVIGAIRLTAEQLGIPIHFQMAYQAKGFCKDDKLTAWGLYLVRQRHANDAIRHGCYYLLFHRNATGKLAR
jgi:hypothetical protein